ncbi:tumor necrosis factor ligand superfamily member 11 isoform X2 [Thunnus albacares]|uniref:tumor necrosis factor ligand superfamily member 11 isoform X2 n=1 Tax=Thunnus maccoyii TaxID=8240 RepID=UPI001C4CCFD7|nr:tumor necrosis factor ligand superfamily member 11 isoform X2 [Thunnus maccoyii]XP_044222161.1 tumor necrosis factor ligand superfamily member 11 isoform X2 [Thunnus albacares]
MAATHSDYRGYLRNTVDMEAGQHRFHQVQHSEPTYRPLLFGTLAVMGLLQVASSVAILLHLTGYLQEEVQTEPVLNALRDTRKKGRCKTPKESLPSAHLPIRAHQEYYKKGEPKPITIDWDELHGYLHKLRYQKGKLQVMESGFYYIYAKTCFRYYKYVSEDSSQTGVPPVDVSNTQLIQYVYHESIKQNSKAAVLMKTGSTMRWNITSYNMYCAQQGRGVRLDDGDYLFVNVSNAWMLDPEGEGTYFGAIKLGN